MLLMHRVDPLSAEISQCGEVLVAVRGSPEDIVEFAEGEQAGIRRDTGAMELQLQAAVETQRARSRIHQPGSPSAASRNVLTALILTVKSAPICINDWSYMGNGS